MRRWLLTLPLLATLGSAWAADVVKIINFSCPVCRASESLDISIRDAVSASGGHFVPAPIPPDETSGARERVYYASRNQGSQVEELVRRSIYHGVQDLEMPLDDNAQTTSWLEDDLTNGPVKVNFTQLIQDADSADAAQALARAARLALRGGVQALPAYLVLKNNQIIAAFDPQSAGSGSLLNLRDAVVKAVQQADAKP